MACTVIDRAIQVHGGAGVSDDFPLARMYGWQRAMRIFDGPDEVHLRTIARIELGREDALGGGGDRQVSSPHERLSGAWNFRDVAETAGVRPGLLFRSSELSKLDAVGREALTDFGIGDVADLRSPREVEHRGPVPFPTALLFTGFRSPKSRTPMPRTKRHRMKAAGRR